MSVTDFLADAADAWADSPALSSLERRWTYAELDRRVEERAAELRKVGTRPGALVPVVLEATAEGIVTLLALWRAGAVPAPLNPRLTRAERGSAETVLSGVTDEDPGGDLVRAAQAVLWTSGTEGRPRGVALSAENLRANALAAAARLDLAPSDTWLASLSLAHVGGLALVVRSLLLGGHLLAVGRFDANLVSGLIDGTEDADLSAGSKLPSRPLTHVSFVPTQLLRVLDQRRGRPPPPSFRCVLLGGAHAPADLVDRALSEGWPIALTYGMTEMTSQVATAPPELVRAVRGTVGEPLDGVELRLGEDGELWVRGPARALGYVATTQVLADAEGWYHTGDLGRLDERGRLWITGRRSERIISGGVTVDPQEVEDALRAHPDVADACVVGLPDPEWGELVAGVLVPFAETLDVDAVAAWARERLAPAKRPRRWSVVDVLPRNANGKVSRRALREALAEGGGR